MPATVDIWLEEGTNIIITKVDGRLSVDDYTRLTEITDQCVKRLPPNSPVLILSDGRKMIETSHRVKRASFEILRRKRIDRIAFFGAANPPGAVLCLLLAIAFGRNRIRYFSTEQEARAWLLS